MAGAMMCCALVGFGYEAIGEVRPIDEGSALIMTGSAIAVALVAGILSWWGRGTTEAPLSRREAIVAVAAIWVGVSMMGAVPLVADTGLAPMAAFFEAVSGFTTTGATVFEDIEGTASRPVLLWRSIMQWLGGMGIVVLFVAIFPGLGVGGKHLFRSEVPGVTADGLRPRIRETSVVLWKIYVFLTILEVVALLVAGMGPFDAVCHSLTTMSTGGFSTRDGSLGAFDSAAVEYVVTVFMLLAGVNFSLYFAAIRSRRLGLLLQSTEFRAYVLGAVVTTTILCMLILPIHQDLERTFRRGLFMVATTLTSTGFGTDAYMAYPPAALVLVLTMMFVGGCAGSTAGGLKVARVVVLAQTALAILKRSTRPHVVQVVRLEGNVVDVGVLLEVGALLTIYIVCLGGGTFALTWLEGVSVQTAGGAMLTTLSNMGPAPFHEGADHFARYAPPAKAILAGAMILGRLEFFTVLALLLPATWKR